MTISQPARRNILILSGLAALTLSGCGWTPLYADNATASSDADLRAIQVEPIAERMGQNLEMQLRNAFNPDGIRTPIRYALRTTLVVGEQDLGIQSEGLGTQGKIDVYATIVLTDAKSTATLLNNQIHGVESFDIESNGYATVVADNDARRRLIDDLSQEIVTRLTVFLQHRAAQHLGAGGAAAR